MEDNLIVVVELGSSNVTGVVGRKQPDGGFQVEAIAQEPSRTFIKRGAVFNVDLTAQCLGNIIQKLEKNLEGKKIYRIYVGISGKGMHSVNNVVSKELKSQVSISNELVETLLEMNNNGVLSDGEILEVVPQEYKVGANYEINPVGVLTDNIEGHFVNIVARPTLRASLEKCLGDARIDVVDYPNLYLAKGKNLLTDTEQRSGCVLVDLGSATTTVLVYRHNILRFLAVIPIGVGNITKDIMSIYSIEVNEAEALKKKYGVAIPETSEPSETETEKSSDVHIRLEDGRSIELSEFSEIVQARVEEIIANVSEQIQNSGYSRDELLGGIVLTGGGSLMKSIEAAFAYYTKFTKFRFAQKLNNTVRISPKVDSSLINYSINGAVSLLSLATQNCCKEITQKTGGLFNVDEDDNEMRKEQEAAEAAKAAAKAAADAAAEADRLKEEERKEAARALKEEKKRRSKEKRHAFFSKIKKIVNGMVETEPDDDDEKDK